jgi:hypothetical protein
MYGVSKLKLGLYGANCSSGRAITLVPERWAGPSGAARRSTPGRQMFERGVNAALAFAAAAAALASCSVRVSGAGIRYCLSVTGFASLPGIQARARRLVAHSTRLPSRDAIGRLYLVGGK